MVPSLLILTDFFQAAHRALDYATNLARPLGARLVLLHVRRDTALAPEMFTGQLSNLNKECIDVAMNSLAVNLPVPVVAEVGYGRVAFAVADAVSRHHPTLVVLGRPNQEDTPDELVSTTALDILRTAPYPMLVVPHAVHTRHAPRRVLLAVDGDPFTLGSYAGTARHLLKALQAEVTVFQVTGDSHSSATPAKALESVERTGLLIDLAQAVRTRSSVAPEPAAEILRVAQPGEFDLVALIARPHSFLGALFHRSVTAQVLLHSDIPVLVLPTDD